MIATKYMRIFNKIQCLFLFIPAFGEMLLPLSGKVTREKEQDTYIDV